MSGSVSASKGRKLSPVQSVLGEEGSETTREWVDAALRWSPTTGKPDGSDESEATLQGVVDPEPTQIVCTKQTPIAHRGVAGFGLPSLGDLENSLAATHPNVVQ